MIESGQSGFALVPTIPPFDTTSGTHLCLTWLFYLLVLVLLAARRPRQSGGIRRESSVLRAAPFRPSRLIVRPLYLTRRRTASAVGYWLARFACNHFVACH